MKGRLRWKGNERSGRMSRADLCEDGWKEKGGSQAAIHISIENVKGIRRPQW